MIHGGLGKYMYVKLRACMQKLLLGDNSNIGMPP